MKKKKPFGELQGAFYAMAATAWIARMDRVKTGKRGWKLRDALKEKFGNS
jgi:hypothetical protein